MILTGLMYLKEWENLRHRGGLTSFVGAPRATEGDTDGRQRANLICVLCAYDAGCECCERSGRRGQTFFGQLLRPDKCGERLLTLRSPWLFFSHSRHVRDYLQLVDGDGS